MIWGPQASEHVVMIILKGRLRWPLLTNHSLKPLLALTMCLLSAAASLLFDFPGFAIIIHNEPYAARVMC